MQEFFYAIDKSEVDQHLAGEHVLVSAFTCFKGGKFYVPGFLEKTRSIFIDSGGFSAQGGYPYSFYGYMGFVFAGFARKLASARKV